MNRHVLMSVTGGLLIAMAQTLCQGSEARASMPNVVIIYADDLGYGHLGHLPQFLPTHNGFDYYFGIPYSMRCTAG